MKTARIKCPKCGKEGFAIPEDLEKTDLTYHCDQCGEAFVVSFFDHCPTCKDNVGFLEGNAFKKDVLSMGKDIISSVINPVSTIDSLGDYFKNAFVGNVDEANGDGICPICHTRYIRCHSCHELQAIELDAVYKDKFKCSHCGLIQFPGHVKEGQERLHSAAFLSDKGSESEKQSMLFQTQKKKPIDSAPPTATQITRREAFKVISFVMHIQMEYIDGTSSVNLGRSALKSFRKKGYNIPERVMYQCRTYNDLADAIIAFKANQYATEPSTSSKTFSSDVKQEQMLTKQMSEKQKLDVKKAECEYFESIREFLEDDTEITPRERKMLDRIRQSLGISEERAVELEASLTPQLTEDEQEYLDMYREYAEKGDITEKERHRLAKFAQALGIESERIKVIEQSF